MATSAASPVITDAAASVNVSPAGFLTTWAAGATTYWAKVPARGLWWIRALRRRPPVGDSRADGGHHAGEVAARTGRFGRRSPAPRRRMYDVRASREVS